MLIRITNSQVSEVFHRAVELYKNMKEKCRTIIENQNCDDGDDSRRLDKIMIQSHLIK